MFLCFLSRCAFPWRCSVLSDLELIDAVAHVTGEDSHEIRRRGFMLTGPEDPATSGARITTKSAEQAASGADTQVTSRAVSPLLQRRVVGRDEALRQDAILSVRQ